MITRHFRRRVTLLVNAVLLAVLAGCDARPPELTSAQQFQQELDAAKADVQLPPGATWPPYLNVTDQAANYSTGGGRSWVEGVAFCTWLRAWMDAARSDDTAAQAQAAAVLIAAPTQEFVRGDNADQTFRDAIAKVVADVRGGNPATVFISGRTPCSDLG
jgi:hypothetical protein